MRILIAEDDMVSRRALQAILTQWGYEVILACDGAEAWQILQRQDAPKLLILDWMMPGMDGIDICRELRQHTGEPYVYIILLTAKSRKEDIIEGMQSGADDYITKPFDSHELKVRLRAGRRVLDLQEQLISARETLRVQATHDGLTGLWNRAMILEILQREWWRARRDGRSMGIILADIDYFKRINDTYGHQIGDTVLCETAQRMRASARAYDSIGRYGGEEFLIVAPDCDGAGAMAQSERLRACIAERAMSVANQQLLVTISLGVMVGPGVDGTDMDSLIRRADEALYRAKRGGRNRAELAVSVVGPNLHPK